MRSVLIVFAVLLGLLGITVAADRPLPEADLTIIIPVEYNTTDPQRQSYNHDIRLTYAIGETLVRWNNQSPDFEVVPALATRWEVSSDALTYTFHMDPEAKWSNGSPVIADHFVYSWRRGIEPELAADYAKMFFAIRGAKKYFDWRTDQLTEFAGLTPDDVDAQLAERGIDAGGKGVRARRLLLAETYLDEADAWFADNVGLKALDDHTLEVRVERPTTYFLDLVAFAVFSPVYPPLVEDHVTINPDSGRQITDYSWTKPPLLVTNGAYRIKAWKFKQAMLLERNPYYRAPELVKSDTIKMLPIADENTGVLAFQNGVADFHSDVRVDYVPDMLAQKKAGTRDDIQAFGTFGTYFWSFNCTPTLSDGRPNPFREAGVRRAFALAVDKQQLTDKVRRSGEPPASVFVPPGSIPGFESPAGLPFDIQRARQELEAAGWTIRPGEVPVNDRGEPFPEVELLVSNAGYHEDIALALGRKWEEAFGVTTRIDKKETKVYRADLKARDFMLARGGWFGDYGDPSTFHYLHRTGDGNNDRGYSDPYVDELLAKADAELDPELRMSHLEEVERYTMEETVPILPIFHYSWYYMYRPAEKPDGSPNPGGLRGVSTHPRLVQYLWMLEVVEGDEGGAS